MQGQATHHSKAKKPSKLDRLKRFADRPWYPALVGFLAGADQFIVIVPIEGLMIPSVLLNPRRWFRTAVWISSGCTLGALHVVQSKEWAHSMTFIQSKGAWALFLISAGPLPQQPAVALAGLSHMPLAKVGLAVWLGRTLKYCVVGYLASHAPKLMSKLFPRFQKRRSA
jgi:membrane protein YqaA with SNARE-associated domain